MEIYTLVGKSGTGKSFHAVGQCQKYDIEAIIDDGLFIYKGAVLAGISAKKSETKIGAIKVALFLDEKIREQVKKEIRRKKPKSLLLLGTSDDMVNKLLLTLELVTEDELSKVHRIYIEDITTEEERETAREERVVKGKHVVPAPSMQLKRSFSGFFMDPLRVFRGMDVGMAAERTVGRPPFSYQGEYFVEDKVLDDIIRCVCDVIPEVSRVIHIGHALKTEAYTFSSVSLPISLYP